MNLSGHFKGRFCVVKMSSLDPKEPFDWFYYWNNQHEYPQAHSKQICPNREPFGKHKYEAFLLQFDKFNAPNNSRDYLHNQVDQNPSALLYANSMYFHKEYEYFLK